MDGVTIIEGGDGVVAVTGDLDTATADQLRRRLAAPSRQVIRLYHITELTATLHDSSSGNEEVL